MMSAKKKALLAYKEKLLNDIKFCEKRLEQVRLNTSRAYVFEDEEVSSDSETGILQTLGGPTTSQQNQQQSNLSVCLHATQELTGLQVLESEVNVAVDPPELDNKAQPPVDGLWREVIAECRIDLVPFSMTFFVHQPSREFAAPGYHNLRVTAVKAAHDAELTQSVLADVRTPSDAVQVIASYAVAHRSRRTTLAHLVDRFADALFIETMPTGGYVLKCADVLRVCWKVQNKWSNIAAFHHQMKFELDCIEEQYLKEIKRTHAQLIDPTLQTDERTAYLAKIIALCLEATKAPTESDTDTEGRARRTTLESEPEMPPERKRSGEKLPEVGVKRSRNKDCEVMAPPKQPPKKGKPRGKVSADGAKGEESAGDDVRKGKGSGNGQNDKENAATGQKNLESAKSVKGKDNVQKVKDNAANGRSGKDKSEKVKENDVNEPKVKEKVVSGQKGKEKNVTVQKNKENVQKPEEVTENGQKDKQNAKTVQKSKESTKTVPKDKENNATAQKVVKKTSNQIDNAKKVVKKPDDRKNVNENNVKAKGNTVNANKEVDAKIYTDNVKKIAKRPLQNDEQINVNDEEIPATTNTDVVSKKTKITEARTEVNTKKVKKTIKVADVQNKEQNEKNKNLNKPEKPPKDSNNKEQTEKSNKVVAKASTKNKTDTNKTETVKETVHGEKIISGNVVQSKPAQTKTKNLQNINEMDKDNKKPTKKTDAAKETVPVEKIISGNIVQPKPAQTNTKNVHKTNENDKNAQNKRAKTQLVPNKSKIADKPENSTKNMPATKIPMKTFRYATFSKPNAPSKNPVPASGKKHPTGYRAQTQNFEKLGSKIPKQKLTSISESNMRRFKNPLRISPRKTQSAVKSGPTVGSSKQMEVLRNSPRLLKKSIVKPKSMFVF